MRFKEAIQQMLKDGEFEKIIKKAKGKDKKAAKEFYELIKDNPDLERLNGITILMAVYSVSVLKDAIAYMELDIRQKKQVD